MQKYIRENGEHMKSDDYKKFVGKKNEGSLVDACLPAKAVAQFVISPKIELSGLFMDWDDTRLTN
jgi:hypothetical protein